jgi:hypothetical protein
MPQRKLKLSLVQFSTPLLVGTVGRTGIVVYVRSNYALCTRQRSSSFEPTNVLHDPSWHELSLSRYTTLFRKRK